MTAPTMPPNHDAGVQAVRCHAGPFEAARELAREEHVRELRLPVRRHWAVAALGVQVVEVDAGADVGARADVDDARGRAGAQPVEQQVRQEEVRQVIGRERGLVAVDGHAA
jgi:hypothetical protein